MQRFLIKPIACVLNSGCFFTALGGPKEFRDDLSIKIRTTPLSRWQAALDLILDQPL